MFWFKTVVACIGRLGITMAFEMVVFVNTELYPTFVRLGQNDLIFRLNQQDLKFVENFSQKTQLHKKKKKKYNVNLLINPSFFGGKKFKLFGANTIT